MRRSLTRLPPANKVAEGALARPRWVPCGIALLAGVAFTFGFAPAGLWWLAVLAPAVLMALWAQAPTARAAAWSGFAFGLGVYSAGTWWLYISIRGFGQAPIWVALGVMGGLVLIMAAYQALLGYVVRRWLRPDSLAGALLWVPAAWVLVEWWRGWFLTGFPWLSLGYSQTDTWLAGLAPLGGVPLVSFALLTGAGALVCLWRESRRGRLIAATALLLPWCAGGLLRDVAWTVPSGDERTVAIVQGAIPQDMKWLVSNQQRILDDYASLHEQALGADLIVWPESALPDVVSMLSGYVGAMWAAARGQGSDMVLGVMRTSASPRGGEPLYFNSMLALGEDEPAFYDKRQLVPFGEHFPVPAAVREWLRLMNLPYSDFTPGEKRQAPLELAGVRLAASICYEDAYPALLRHETRLSDALVTVTNDAWFGRSGARYQHLQIARMRALESRRYLLRAANDGVSAVIAPDGQVVARAPEFEPAVLRATFTPLQGDTPYLATGNWLVLGLAWLALASRWLRFLKRPRNALSRGN